jgi:acetolactate synthase I/II/III large subunit
VQQLEVPRDAMFLQSGGSATMGFGVGAAIGAAFVADGRRTVIAVVGDGGFLTHPSAVATAVEHDLPIIWVVWNNAGYVSIRDLQRGFFGKERKFLTRFRKNGFGDLMSTDFAMLGRAMGAAGVHADSPASLGDAITTAIRKKIPTVIDVKIMAHAMRHAAGSWDLAAIAGPAPNYDLDPVR